MTIISVRRSDTILDLRNLTTAGGHVAENLHRAALRTPATTDKGNGLHGGYAFVGCAGPAEGRIAAEIEMNGLW